LNQKHQVIADSTKVFIANATSGIFAIIRGIVVAGVLGPVYFGIWSMFNVTISYIPYIHFGLLDGMTKLVPRLRSRGELERSNAVRDNSFSVIMIFATLVPIVMVIGSFIFQKHFSSEAIVGFRILAGFTVLFQIYTFLCAFIRIDQRFGLLSASTVGIAVCSLIFVLVFFKILSNNLYAVLVGMIATYFVMDVFILSATKYDFKFSLDFSVLKKIFYFGFPVGLVSTAYIVFISADRWIVATMLSRKELGYYGIGFIMGSLLSLLPASIAFTLYTRMLRRYGETNDPRSSERLVYLPALAVSYLMAVVCVLAAVVLPVFVRLVLPSYADGTDVATIFVLAAYFVSFRPLFVNFLVSIDKEMQIFAIQIIAIALNLTVNIILIKSGYGIKAVAFGTGLSYLFCTSATIILAICNFTTQFKEILLRIVQLYLPFFITLAAFLLLRSMFGAGRTGVVRDVFSALLQSVVLILVAVPLFFHLNKKIAVVELVREMLRR